ncbi:MAG: penicillin-binding transpeptidase domain-containing protein [Oscillospiraceae bacterium]|nr:penicillin-binding transpeptidase domain-containing protein [Oscillospiraceae bacterium]
MNRVRRRALAVYLLVAVAVLGLGFYVVRFFVHGSAWASAPFNQTVHRAGILTVGRVVDRNGVVLADVTDGRRSFADSAEVRRATLHAVGDREGNVGTGALSLFAAELMGYNPILGSTNVTGAGNTVTLNIDSALNVEALRALDGRRGVVMVSNYETGEVLAMVSSPTFDPTQPPTVIDDEEGIFLNRAIQAAYTPGSAFKVLTAAAALDNVRDLSSRIFECTGEMRTSRGIVTCPSAHGNIGIIDAMRVSCNIAFGELAIEMGPIVMSRYVERMGLSGRTTVSGMATASGNFDRADPDTADLAWSGVGQFTNTVCPASMLRFMGAIANDGVAIELQLRSRQGLGGLMPVDSERLMDVGTAQRLSEIIRIQNRVNFPGLEIHAKTGTAQVGGDMLPHAWFVGYITNEDFPLAFVVVVENAGGGAAVAAPIANRVLQSAVRG